MVILMLLQALRLLQTCVLVVREPRANMDSPNSFLNPLEHQLTNPCFCALVNLTRKQHKAKLSLTEGSINVHFLSD